MAITNDLPPSSTFETEAGEDLRLWSASRLLALFATLNAPGATELDGEVGEGYNMWRKDSCDERTSRFAWEIGPSTIGDGESLVMRYAAFRNRSPELDLIDEVRRVRDGLYVGVYHTPMVIDPFTRTLRSDGQRTEPEVFLLAGPIGEWQGPDDPDLELLN